VRPSTIIGNLLDLSRMEAGMMEYELNSNDVVPLIRTTVAELEPRAGEKGISFHMLLPERPLPTHCDADRILQVLGNVLGNAIKFSPYGKKIEIRASYTTDLPPSLPEFWRRSVASPRRGGGFVAVQIADSGPGIHPSHREKIFERFQQVQQTKGLSGQGVGLGLAICRTIIQAHQGAIWVEENPGRGSIFCILLPAAGSSEITHSVSGPI
jgi:signal transduction histidine kinase